MHLTTPLPHGDGKNKDISLKTPHRISGVRTRDQCATPPSVLSVICFFKPFYSRVRTQDAFIHCNWRGSQALYRCATSPCLVSMLSGIWCFIPLYSHSYSRPSVTAIYGCMYKVTQQHTSSTRTNNDGLTLAQCHRRWANVKPSLFRECRVL